MQYIYIYIYTYVCLFMYTYIFIHMYSYLYLSFVPGITRELMKPSALLYKSAPKTNQESGTVSAWTDIPESRKQNPIFQIAKAIQNLEARTPVQGSHSLQVRSTRSERRARAQCKRATMSTPTCLHN